MVLGTEPSFEALMRNQLLEPERTVRQKFLWFYPHFVIAIITNCTITIFLDMAIKSPLFLYAQKKKKCKRQSVKANNFSNNKGD